MNGIERLAVEIRHLQRTEVGEAEEGFSKGQKGSSAMPHKRNPIASENLTGLSRLVRGYLFSSLENIPLWHERDISHSSVERVIFPDAFIVVDYALNRMAQVISGLEVYPSRMAANMQMNQGQIFSSHVLLALIQKGMSRDEAYQLVQAHSHSLKKGKTLEASLNSDLNVKKLLTKSEIKKIFSGDSHRKNFNEIIKRVLHD